MEKEIEKMFSQTENEPKSETTKNEPFRMPESIKQLIEKNPALKKKWEKIEILLNDEWTAHISKKAIEEIELFFVKVYAESVERINLGEVINGYNCEEDEEKKKDAQAQQILELCKHQFYFSLSSSFFHNLTSISKVFSENEKYRRINDQEVISLFIDFIDVLFEKQKIENRKIVKQRENFPIFSPPEGIIKAIEKEMANKDYRLLQKKYAQSKKYSSLKEQWEQLNRNFTIRPYYKALHEDNMKFMNSFIQQIFSDVEIFQTSDEFQKKYDMRYFFGYNEGLTELESQRKQLEKILFPVPELGDKQNEFFLSLKKRLEIIPFFIETKKTFALAVETKGKTEKTKKETSFEKVTCSCCFRKIGLAPVSNTLYDHGYHLYKTEGNNKVFWGQTYNPVGGSSTGIRSGYCQGVNFPVLEISLDGLNHFIKENQKEIIRLESSLQNLKKEIGDIPIYEWKKEDRRTYFELESSLRQQTLWGMWQEKQKGKWEKIHSEKKNVESKKQIQTRPA